MDKSLCSPQGGSGSKPPAGNSPNLYVSVLSCALRGFPETLGKEAHQDWMETL